MEDNIAQNVRQPYVVRTISSRHTQCCRKMVMQNLQDFRKTKQCVVQFPHCSLAVIVQFSAVVVRFAAFLQQPCRKQTVISRWSVGFRKTNALVTNYNVSRTNTCVSCSSIATALRVFQLSCVLQKTHKNPKENEPVKNLVLDVVAILRCGLQHLEAAARNPEMFNDRA